MNPSKEELIDLLDNIHRIAEEYGIPVLGRIPIQPEIAAKVDAGQVEYVEGNWLDEAAAKIQK